MVKDNDTPSFASLIEGIIADFQLLFRQELALARSEVRQEWDKMKKAATALSWGMMVFAIGSIFLGQMLVYFLNWLTELPLWVCCGLLGALCFVVGMGLYQAGRHWAGEVKLMPRQTLLTMKDNAQCLKSRK